MASIPPPPTTTPPSTHPTSYRSVRESELDAIRRRGLAKIFNKHFTSVTETISREREVAEAAIAEIERRKADLAANPKEFQGGHGHGDWNLTHLDQLYLELSRRKIEVQRKEKETQELYKRYVAQYGMKDGLAIIKSTPPSKYSYSGGGGLMPLTHESIDGDVIHQADLLMRKIAQRTAADVNNVCAVDSMAKQIEEKIKTFHSSADVIPSNEQHLDYNPSPNSTASSALEILPTGGNQSSSPSSNKNVKFAEQCRSEIPDYKMFDESLAPLTLVTPQRMNEPNTPEATTVSVNLSFENGDSPSMASNVQIEDEFDADSILSALTEMDGVTVAEAEWRLTEFLRTETDNIRKMLIPELTSSYDHPVDQDTDSNTVYSVDSKRSTDATLAAERMARNMVDATAWMNDPSHLVNEADVRESDEDTRDASPAVCEWHAYWSTEHNREYYYNSNTKQTCWSRPQRVLIDTSNLTLQGKSLVYAKDEVVAEVKDYSKRSVSLVTTKRNNAMSENNEMIDLYKPDSGRSVSDNSTILSGGSVSSKRSKLSEYRYQMIRRKRRKQRLVLVIVVGILAFALFYYTQKLRHDRQLSEQKLVEAERLRLEAEAGKTRLEEEELTRLRNELERLEWIKHLVHDEKNTDSEVHENETSFVLKDEDTLINELQKEGWNMDTSEGEPHEFIVKDDIIEVPGDEGEANHKDREEIPNTNGSHGAASSVGNELSAIVIKGTMDDPDSSTIAVVVKDDQFGIQSTPVGCHFPFAYVVSVKCRHLAEKKPWFDVQSLVDNMLQ